MYLAVNAKEKIASRFQVVFQGFARHMPFIAGMHAGFYFYKVYSLLLEHSLSTSQDLKVFPLRIDFQVVDFFDFPSEAEFVKRHYIHIFSQHVFIRWRLL